MHLRLRPRPAAGGTVIDTSPADLFSLGHLAARVAQLLGPAWWSGGEDGRPAACHPDGMSAGFEPALADYPGTDLFLLHLTSGDEYESAAFPLSPTDDLAASGARAAAVRAFLAEHGHFGPAGHFCGRHADNGPGYQQPPLADCTEEQRGPLAPTT